MPSTEGPSQGGPTITEFEWVQFETCPFSSPAVASPECSTEVTPATLTPTVQSQPAPLAETLPVTGTVTTAVLVTGYFLIIMGLSAMFSAWYYDYKRKKLEDKWHKEDAEEAARWKDCQ